MAGVDLASWFVVEAVGAYGDQVLADASPGAPGPRAVGRELARLIFVRAETDTGIPAPLAAVIGGSGSGEAEQALETCIGDLLGADPGLAAAAAEVLGRYYRQQLDCGDGQALAELGDLLWWDEPELARTAFERAADAGNDSALIRLAQHRWVVLEDYDGAVPHFHQAITSPDPDVAAEALTGLGRAHRAHGDYQAARDVLEEAIATGHPDWAPRAMMMLGGMLEYQLRGFRHAQPHGGSARSLGTDREPSRHRTSGPLSEPAKKPQAGTWRRRATPRKAHAPACCTSDRKPADGRGDKQARLQSLDTDLGPRYRRNENRADAVE